MRTTLLKRSGTPPRRDTSFSGFGRRGHDSLHNILSALIAQVTTIDRKPPSALSFSQWPLPRLDLETPVVTGSVKLCSLAVRERHRVTSDAMRAFWATVRASMKIPVRFSLWEIVPTISFSKTLHFFFGLRVDRSSILRRPAVQQPEFESLRPLSRPLTRAASGWAPVPPHLESCALHALVSR